jgi:hypothetical protein
VQWLRLPADLSAQTIARKVEQRFGLPGFARLVKILELLAASPYRDSALIELPASDWLDALVMGRAEFDEFFTYLTAADWLTLEQGAEPGAPLRVTLLQVGDLLPGAGDLNLFTKPCQWQAWCIAELGMPKEATTDPYVQQLFRRWCASNVTVTEAGEAVQAAIAKQNSLHPTALHTELQAIRAARLERARA